MSGREHIEYIIVAFCLAISSAVVFGVTIGVID